VRQLDGACHAGAEADTVVGAVDVVVHRLRYRDDVHAFVVQALAIAERVVPTDGNQDIHSDVLEVLEHVLGGVVDRLVIARQMRRQALARHVAGAQA